MRLEPKERAANGRRNKLRLDLNENTVGAPPHVLDFFKRYLTAADLAIYPDYDHALEDLALHYSVRVEELTLTNGTDEAIQIIVNTYVDEGDEVVLLRPSYASYRFFSTIAGACVHEIEYRPEAFDFPHQEMLDRIGSRTRAVFIGNPNDPTGTPIDASAIEQILSKAEHAAVVIDEAYYEFSGITVLPLLGQHPNLFVSRTFSNIYGLAGVRCGCLFSDAANMIHVRKAQSPYSVNSLAAMAARIAVKDQKFIEDYVLEVLSARELVYLGLERLGVPYVKSRANFVLFQAGARCTEIRSRLREQAILVHECGAELPGYIRLTIGTRDQMQQFLDELQQIW